MLVKACRSQLCHTTLDDVTTSFRAERCLIYPLPPTIYRNSGVTPKIHPFEHCGLLTTMLAEVLIVDVHQVPAPIRPSSVNLSSMVNTRLPEHFRSSPMLQ